MKKKFSILIIIMITFSTVISLAHGGKTDDNGGHYDRSTGEYHYHHGYSEHQHINGVCPYDYVDKTDHSTSFENSTQNTYERKSPIKNTVDSLFQNKIEYNTIKNDKTISSNNNKRFILGIFAIIFIVGLIIDYMLHKKN